VSGAEALHAYLYQRVAPQPDDLVLVHRTDLQKQT
jgi:hypothetical protein